MDLIKGVIGRVISKSAERAARGRFEIKVDGTSFSDAGSLVTTVHLTREICPQDLNYRKSKTNMGAQKLLLTRCFFFPVCPRLD